MESKGSEFGKMLKGKPKKNKSGFKELKIVFIGDGASGAKSSFIDTYINKAFQHNYIPKIFEDYRIAVNCNNVSYHLGLRDTAGQDDYDAMIPMNYAGADYFVIGFSIGSQNSFDAVRTKWVLEVKKHCPEAPIILLGAKRDIRDEQEGRDYLSAKGRQAVTKDQGFKCAQDIGAIGYFEVCNFYPDEVNRVMEGIVASISASEQKLETAPGYSSPGGP